MAPDRENDLPLTDFGPSVAPGKENSLPLTGFGPPDAFGRQGDGDNHLERGRSPAGGNNHAREFCLPRVDGGKDAWLFLAGCFCIEALVWGG